jgi:predicted small secreted protein
MRKLLVLVVVAFAFAACQTVNSVADDVDAGAKQAVKDVKNEISPDETRPCKKKKEKVDCPCQKGKK